MALTEPTRLGLLLTTRGRFGWAKILSEIIHNDIHFIVVKIGPFREHQIDHSRPLFLRRSFRRHHFQRVTRNTRALHDGFALSRREARWRRCCSEKQK